MMKKLCLPLLALSLAGCAMFPTQQGYAQKVYRWQGRDVNELLAQWGAPTKTMQMPNGNSLYTYVKESTEQRPLQENTRYEPGTKLTMTDKDGQSRVVETPGRWVSNGMTGGGTVHYECTTNFVVDKKTKEVLSVSFDGNNCLAVEQQ
ncbi:hypothetical protein LQR31_18845 [Chromobacterium vaccinii]|uniref:Lipoprotein n=1 Tax=Chromobacterium vaccinii TaxID=1108595 RepID=A0A1D9LKK1_9NEIS|nr:hypothetical protein [Chromobacterium vaccinii]AOZ51785.1 hypothetical protein BKX93_18475 [Chromobacterium vaccinii]MCD4486537.1 hypothetical protein [Chromobacterium vaccinii]MCD4500699.1 hypothetical protein [Chromobacterium vaccinii]QND86743.1 Uncharacterized protein ChrSW_4518 [Chromobacterium vaccinii]QND91974.1 Uncharacterized protein ChrSV_4518 [Chromobacterium vaccinii]